MVDVTRSRTGLNRLIPSPAMEGRKQDARGEWKLQTPVTVRNRRQNRARSLFQWAFHFLASLGRTRDVRNRALLGASGNGK